MNKIALILVILNVWRKFSPHLWSNQRIQWLHKTLPCFIEVVAMLLTSKNVQNIQYLLFIDSWQINKQLHKKMIIPKTEQNLDTRQKSVVWTKNIRHLTCRACNKPHPRVLHISASIRAIYEQRTDGRGCGWPFWAWEHSKLCWLITIGLVSKGIH